MDEDVLIYPFDRVTNMQFNRRWTKRQLFDDNGSHLRLACARAVYNDHEDQ